MEWRPCFPIVSLTIHGVKPRGWDILPDSARQDWLSLPNCQLNPISESQPSWDTEENGSTHRQFLFGRIHGSIISNAISKSVIADPLHFKWEDQASLVNLYSTWACWPLTWLSFTICQHWDSRLFHGCCKGPRDSFRDIGPISFHCGDYGLTHICAPLATVGESHVCSGSKNPCLCDLAHPFQRLPLRRGSFCPFMRHCSF